MKGFNEYYNNRGILSVKQKKEIIEDYTQIVDNLHAILKLQSDGVIHLTNEEQIHIHETIKLLTYFIFNLGRDI